MSGMSPKAKWTIEEVECDCKTLGVPCEDKPYFNLCALAVTMNMEVSDHEKTIGKHFANDTQAIHFIYEWAIEDLMDKYHPEYIRPYFNL